MSGASKVRPKAAPETAEVRRSAAPPMRKAAAGAPRYLKASLAIGGVNDPEEREAERAGRVVASGGQYRVRDPGGGAHLRAAVAAPVADPGGEVRVRRMAAPEVVDPGAAGRVRRAATPTGLAEPSGAEAARRIETARSAVARPLPTAIKARLERGFGQKLDGVRVHTGPAARSAAAAIGARAYTEGNRITLGHGESEHDLHLMAHETTHVMQNRAATRASETIGADTGRADPVRGGPVGGGRPIRRFGVDTILDFLADKANLIPGFRMFTIVLGVNPVNMSSVDRSAANILRAVVELMPGGGLIVQALDKYGVFDKAGNWISQQIDSLGITGAAIGHAVSEFVDSLHWRDALHPGDVWDRAKRIFSEPIDRIIAFIHTLVDGVIQFVKNAVIRPLAVLASKTRAWNLLIALLGKNPITGDPVPQTAEALIGGFMKLIAQEDVWEKIQKSGVIARTFAWFKGAMATLVSFAAALPGVFLDALKSFSISDLLDLPGAVGRVLGTFGNFVGKFISWAADAVWKLLQIVFDAVSPGAWGYIQKTGAALKSILKNPLPFVGHLVKAAKLGLSNFADNVAVHLKTGLLEWLTGALPGVYIPKAFSLSEMGMFALSVLSVTWGQIRGRIVKALGPTGEKIMSGLETTLDVVVALVKGGPAAAWEIVKDKLIGLKDMVVGGIIGFVVDTIVKKAIPKLLAMFIPGAGFISAIISIYDTIKAFIERLSKIVAAVTAFIDSIVAIAAGQVAGAAARVERALASVLSLAIGLLAGFLGLGGIADKIKAVVEKVRGVIDKALDAAVAWIVGKAKALLGRLFRTEDKKDERTPQQKETAVAAAQSDAQQLIDDPSATVAAIQAGLPAIKNKYQLTRIGLEHDGDDYDIIVVINPERATKKRKFDPSQLAVGDVVLGKYKDPRWLDLDKEKWVPGSVAALDASKGSFTWKSSNLAVPRIGTFRIADHEKTWKKGNVSQVKIPEDEIIEYNKEQSWASFDVARIVLNYRHHKAQFNAPGFQWEHIIEQSAGGANSSGNLALTAATVNNRLGVLFGKQYASHDAPDGLPGTDGLPLRQYLAGKPLYIQNKWKQHFYAEMGISLTWSSSDRGIWRELG